MQFRDGSTYTIKVGSFFIGDSSGLAAGQAEIAAKDTVSGFSGSCVVQVVKLRSEPESLTLALNEGRKVNVFGGTDYRWTSQDSSIASVNASGWVNGVTTGSTSITVTDVATQAAVVIPVRVINLTVSPAEIYLNVNGQKQLSASGGASYQWQSSDDRIATVSASGLVQGISSGDATIVVTDLQTQMSADCLVHVVALTLTPGEVWRPEGGTIQFSARSTSTGSSFAWYSLDTSIVSIDQTGLATCKAAGSTQIKVTDSVSGAVSAAAVSVVKVAVTPKQNEVVAGKTVQLLVRGGTSYQWASNNPQVAIVNEQGLVTAAKGGTAQVTATDTLSGALDTATVKVVQLAIEPQQATIGKGGSQKFVVSGGSSYYWSASDPSITFNQQGFATFPKTGTFTITVTDSSGASVQATVTVIEISVTPNQASIPKGGTLQLTARGGSSYTWQSDKSAVAKVDSNGLVSGLSAGTALITACDKNSGATSTATLKVVEVSLQPNLVNLSLGQTILLTAKGGTYYQWQSSDPQIASIQDGLVYAEGVGTGAVITVTDTVSGSRAQATINVYNLTPASTSLKKGETLQLKVSGVTVSEWRSDDASVATVDGSGLVFGQAAGTTIIRAQDAQGNELGMCSLRVVDLSITPKNPTIPLNEEKQLTASGGVAPQGGGNPVYQWSSSDVSKVSVTTAGLIKGKKSGQAIITVKDEASGIETSTTVIVVKIETTPAILYLKAGDVDGKEITASGGTTYTYTSSQTNIATISAKPDEPDKAIVHGRACGTASLTVKDQVSGASYVATAKVICVTISPDKAEVAVGSGSSFTPQGGDSYEWSANDPSVQTNNQGQASFTQAGTFTITVRDKASQALASAQVTVVALAIQEPAPYGLLGKEVAKQCTVQVSPASYAGHIEWSSSNSDVATVDNSGLVTGLAAGRVEIKVTDTKTGAYNTCNITITEVQVKPQVVSLIVNGQTNLSTQINPSGYSGTIEWSSNDPGVATVTSQGQVRGVAVGSTTIKATDKSSNAVGYATVNVASVAVRPKNLLLSLDKTSTLTASGATTSGVAGYTWSSALETIATVSTSGVVRGISPGETTITVQDAALPEAKDTATVCVVAVQITPASLVLAKGSAKSLAGQALPGTHKPAFLWTSQDTSVATVDANGKVTGVKAGNTVIILKDTLSGAIANCPVNVVAVQVAPATAAITVNGNPLSLVAGGGSGYTWNSSDPSVAMVNSGVVTGVKPGEAVITATDIQSQAAGQMTVKVVAVDLTPKTGQLKAGGSLSLQAKGGTTYVWSSNQQSVAAVSDTGLVRGLLPGNAIIQVIDKDSGATATGSITVVKVNIEPETIQVGKAKSRAITWGLAPSGYSGNLVWKSQNPETVEVNSQGTLSGLKVGQTLITLTDQTTGAADSVQVSVVEIRLEPSNIVLTSGGEKFLQVSGGTSYDWSLDGTEGIIYLQQPQANGCAVKAGTKNGQVRVKVTDRQSGATAEALATVVSIQVNPAAAAIALLKSGQTAQTQPSASVQLAAEGGTSYTWSSNDAGNMVTLFPGQDGRCTVTSTGAGTGVVTVTARDVSGVSSNATVTVVEVNPAGENITVGTKKVLNVAVKPSNYQGRYMWSIIPSSVAMVNETGTVTGLSAGTATVTVTEETSGAQGIASIRVVTLEASPKQSYLNLKGGSKQLNLTFTPAEYAASGLAGIKWTSNNPQVAGVDTNGLVTSGGKTGAATITITDQTSGAVNTAQIQVVEVKVDPAAVNLAVRSSKQLTASGGGTYTWESLEPQITMVDQAGRVTGMLPGTARIVATDAGSGFSGQAILQVVGLAITPQESVTLRIQGTQVLQAQVQPAGYTASLKWSSSNEAVAKINTQGVVTGVGGGSAVITLRDTGSGAEVSKTVKVEVTLSKIYIDPAASELERNQTLQLTANGQYTDGSFANISSVVWRSESEKENIGTVDQKGIFTAHAPGQVKIYASQGQIQGEATVVVKVPSLVGLEIAPLSTTLEKNGSQVFALTAVYSDGGREALSIAGANVSWQSSDTAVGTVTQGLFKAQNPGKSTVTVAVEGVQTTAQVQVKEAVLQSLKVTPDNASLELGEAIQFKAEGRYSDGSVQDLTSGVAWQSSKTEVGSFSSSVAGFLKAAQAGETKVTVVSGNLKSNVISVSVRQPVLISLRIAPETASLEIGQRINFKAIGTYSNKEEKEETTKAAWTVTDKQVGFIDQSGVFSGLKKGTTYLEAAMQGVKARIPVDVKEISLLSITVKPENVTIFPHDTFQLSAEGIYSDGSMANMTGQVVWESTDGTMVKVETGGKLTALITGTCGVRAKSADGQVISNEASVTINDPVLTKIRLTPTKVTMEKGRDQQFEAVGIYSNNTEVNITAMAEWLVENIGIGLMDEVIKGLFHASTEQSGQTSLKVSFSGQSAAVQITIKEADLLSLAIEPKTISLEQNGEQLFAARGHYSDGSEAEVASLVNWIIDKPTAGIISKDGLFKAKKAGTATIKAVLNTIESNVASVTVKEPVIVKLSVTPSGLTALELNRKAQFQVTAHYSDSHTEDVINLVQWQLTNDLVGQMSTSGMFTPDEPGTTYAEANLGGLLSNTVVITVKVPALVKIQITPASLTLPLGYDQQYTVTGLLTDGSSSDYTGEVTWQSSNPDFARIEASGLLSGSAIGVCEVVAIAEGIQSEASQVTITEANPSELIIQPGTLFQPPSSDQGLNVSPVSQYLESGSQVVVPLYINMVKGITSWKIKCSYQADLLEFDDVVETNFSEDVVITGSSAGLVEIAGQIPAGSTGSGILIKLLLTSLGKTGVANLNLTFPKGSDNGLQYAYTSPAMVTVYDAPFTIDISDTQQFVARVRYSDDSLEDLTHSVNWWIDQNNIASIGDSLPGQLLARSAGDTTVYARFGTLSSNAFAVRVLQPHLVGIRLEPEEFTLSWSQEQPEGRQLKVIGDFSDGSQTTLNGSTEAIWQTGDECEGVVSVVNGFVQAEGKGICQVTAMSVVNNTLTASSLVTVLDTSLYSITILPKDLTIQESGSQQFTAIGYYEDDQSKDLTSSVKWTYSDFNSGKVDEKGVFKAALAGTGQIQAALGSVVGFTSVQVVDMKAPGQVKNLSATVGHRKVQLAWTNPGDGDFTACLILRKEGVGLQAMPQNGTSYQPGDIVDGATVVYIGNNNSYLDTDLVNGKTYTYAIQTLDEMPNYSAGVKINALPKAPEISVSPASYDFKEVAIGKESRWDDLLIKNIGSDGLTIDSILSTNPVFSLLSPNDFSLILVPGARVDASVQFTPQEVGIAQGKLTINNDDPEHPELSLDMTGKGIADPPDIEVSDTQLNFGEVVTYSQQEQTFTISNNGQSPLLVKTVSSSVTDCRISGINLPVQISPGNSITVAVTFKPASVYALDPDSDYIMVTSDDPDEALVKVALSGEGVLYLVTNQVSMFYGKASIDEVGVPNGDIIYAYDDDGIMCGAFTVNTIGQYGTMAVFGDDPLTNDVDEGAGQGEPVEFWIYDADTGRMQKPQPDVKPVWKNGQFANVNLKVSLRQDIPLSKGLNWISFTVNNCYYDTPQSPDVPLLDNVNYVPIINDLNKDNSLDIGDVLISINGLYDWVRSYDQNGEHYYYPGKPKQSNLHYMASGYGYEIKMKRSATLILSGPRADENSVLRLTTPGQYLLGFWQNTLYYDSLEAPVVPLLSDYSYSGTKIPVEDISMVWDSLGSAYSSIMMMTSSGYVFYVPSLQGTGFNNLHYIGPGCGYLINFMNEGTASVEYPPVQ